ncbi:MAG: CHRD domain-containing protein [bacterium]|nr:CHRD domain-containing protein [bacterium]
MSLLLTIILGMNFANADHLADRLTFSARLTPAPGVTTNGNGVGAFMLNSTRDTMYFTTSATKLSSPINGFHIHNGRTGGNVIFDFDKKIEDNSVRSFITGPDLNARLVADFIEGNLYIAAHTVNNPSVEIFGFIKLESDWGFAATINGGQAATNSMAIAHASINFGMKGDTAIVRAVTNLTNPITAVHLHFGKMGQNGGVALGLDNTVTSNGISLNGGVAINGAAWTNLMAALMSDSVYINFHTSAFPNGEIRGQVSTTKTLRFDSWLNSAAITTGGGMLTKPSTGNGVSTLWLNNSMDTLTYKVMFNGLSSNAVAAHFHMGEPNQSGGVVKEITISGNMLSGVWTKYDAMNPLTNALISNLLAGSLYYVIHTDSNPGGEIRGQALRLAREGFIGEFDGKQAMTYSKGRGTAIATYDRDRTNLHYMFTIDNLTSDITASHLHKGVVGMAGGVHYDLGMPINNGFYNYWTAANGFNNTQSLPLRRGDSIYVNIHTAMFPNGEVRAQLWRNYKISSPSMEMEPKETPDYLGDRLTFSARLNPAAGVTTGGNGVGAFMLNSSRDTLYFTLSATKLSSKINGYHIHNGRTGGDVIIDFDGKIDGTNVRSFITGSQLASLLPDFIEGNLYVAVHTVNNPAVEIFGFVKLESDWGYAANIDGAQANTNSMANGHATISFGMKGDTAVVKLVSTLSNKIQAVHLHFGKAGQAGGVALDLTGLIAKDGFSLVGGTTISPASWTNLMAALLSDSVYINLHTGSFPNGEIRGQLNTTKTLRFDSWLNQDAIVNAGGIPNQMSNAYGVSSLSLNNTMDTLKFNVLFTGLSSITTAAHFHNANEISNGGVVKELTIAGNMISGVWTKNDGMNPLTNLLISELLKGNIYFVVHTTNNPNGEIRGQVYRLAREGFIAEINGMQSNTNSIANGTAITSYDRDRTNLHSMVALEGLQGNITGAHIHLGKKGEMGAVAIDLDPFTNNGSYLYAKSNLGFNDLISQAMRRNDSTYVNIHTSVFANGEIRGQLLRNYRISSLSSSPTGVTNFNVNLPNGINVYPNPIANELNINLNAFYNGNATVVIYDLNGKTVLTKMNQVSAGNNVILLNTENLSPGLFIVELQLNNELIARTKIIKD